MYYSIRRRRRRQLSRRTVVNAAAAALRRATIYIHVATPFQFQQKMDGCLTLYLQKKLNLDTESKILGIVYLEKKA